MRLSVDGSFHRRTGACFRSNHHPGVHSQTLLVFLVYEREKYPNHAYAIEPQGLALILLIPRENVYCHVKRITASTLRCLLSIPSASASSGHTQTPPRFPIWAALPLSPQLDDSCPCAGSTTFLSVSNKTSVPRWIPQNETCLIRFEFAVSDETWWARAA